VALPDAIPKLLQTAAKLKAGGSGNEANTKALLIEPMMHALGWDPVDLDAVEREVKVFEGTFLDYALKLDGKTRVYVEAKGVNENLDDKKFIAQTVNYANNDGVLWCVLTNGSRVRVYKTNEPVAMDRKLLFEVDLADESETAGEKAKLLRLISREAVEARDLDRFGERVFTDGRVRKALADLAVDPPKNWLDALATRLGHPVVPVEAVKRSLARILDAPTPTAVPARGAVPVKAPLSPPGPPSPPKGQEYALDHHLGNKSALITELFDEVNAFATSLGGDVTRRIRKLYIAYFRGKRSFFTIELQHQRAIVYLALDPTALQPWNEEMMRDARNFGHFGMGDTEYSLRNVDQFDELKALIQTAYDARA
jgi:predicted transport protein